MGGTEAGQQGVSDLGEQGTGAEAGALGSSITVRHRCPRADTHGGTEQRHSEVLPGSLALSPVFPALPVSLSRRPLDTLWRPSPQEKQKKGKETSSFLQRLQALQSGDLHTQRL